MEYYPDTLINLGYTNIFNQINFSDFILSIPNYVWSIFYIIFIVVFLVYSVTLFYHWHRYRAYNPVVVIARLVYIGGSVLLLYFSGSFLINYLY